MAKAQAEEIHFPFPNKSYKAVVRFYASTNKNKTNEEAMNFILSGLQALSEDDFVESIYSDTWGCTLDIYGFMYDNHPWYVKFCIKDGLLADLSFHPPEKDLTTQKKQVIRKGALHA